MPSLTICMQKLSILSPFPCRSSQFQYCLINHSIPSHTCGYTINFETRLCRVLRISDQRSSLQTKNSAIAIWIWKWRLRRKTKGANERKLKSKSPIRKASSLTEIKAEFVKAFVIGKEAQEASGSQQKSSRSSPKWDGSTTWGNKSETEWRR